MQLGELAEFGGFGIECWSFRESNQLVFLIAIEDRSTGKLLVKWLRVRWTIQVREGRRTLPGTTRLFRSDVPDPVSVQAGIESSSLYR
jgi:hypothetical protein